MVSHAGILNHGTSPITLNATITGLKFCFGVTLDRGALISKMQHVFVPRTRPVVLSREEVRCLIAAAGSLKYQTALSVAYGAGLRASEVVALKVTDFATHLLEQKETLQMRALPTHGGPSGFCTFT